MSENKSVPAHLMRLIAFTAVVALSACGSPSMTTVTVSPAAPTVLKGATQQFTATAAFDDGTTQDVTTQTTWTSSKTDIATISAAGLATAIAEGSTTITAGYGGMTGTATLTVSAPTISTIALTPANPTLAKGTTQKLTATATYSDKTTKDVSELATWASADATKATVSNTAGSKGLVTGVAAGTSVVSASVGAIKGTTTVTVSGASLASIAVTPPTPSLAVGATQTFTATGTFSDNTTQDVTSQATWTSSDETVATVDATGLATAKKAGTTTITAAMSGKTGTATITVTTATLSSIAVTPPAPSVAVGSKQQFTATGTYSDHSTKDLTTSVTWSSATTAVATIVPATGLATAVAAGTSVITATLGTVSGNTTLTVTGASLVSIAVTPPSPSIVVGATQKFVATGTYSDTTTQDITATVTWASSNTNVATISNAAGTVGTATGVSAGSITISATLSGTTGSTGLTVTVATLKSIAVTPHTPTIAAGATQQFTATGTYTDNSTKDITTSVTWSSAVTAVATISNAAGSNGLASAVIAGTTTITATLGAVSGTASLTVTTATLKSIAVTPPTPSIAAGTTQQFIATGTYSDNSTKDITSAVTWSSATTPVATISNAVGTNGLATAVAAGSSIITATQGTVSGTATLTVTTVTLVSISVTPPNTSVAAGSSQQFTATGTYSDTTTQNITSQVTWSSSNGSAATISNASGTNGLATTLAAGTTTITATLSGKSGSTNLTVTPATLATIVVTPATASIAAGTNQQYTATGTYSDNSKHDITVQVTWSSSNESAATISNASGTNGLAAGAAAGTTTITATLSGINGSASLSVTAATLKSIAVTPSTATIPATSTQQFTATGTYTDNSTQNLTSQVTWSSSNQSAATISNATGTNGLASGAAAGTTTITATLGSVSGSATLNVNAVTLVSISITPKTPSIAKGTSVQFTATGTYSDNSTQNVTANVTWASANGSVASISNATGSNGLANGAAQGTSSISATLGTISDSTTLTVTAATLTSISVTPALPSMPAGLGLQFTATGTYSDTTTQNLTTTATWGSSNTSAATVSSAVGTEGLAATVAPGLTTISATVATISGSTNLTVTTGTLVSIDVTPANPHVPKATTAQLTATGNYSDGSNHNITTLVTWGSSDPSVATISNAAGTQGLVSALNIGEGAIIISATVSGVSGTTLLTVTPAALVSIAVTPPTASIAKGTTTPYTATGTYTDLTTQDITAQVTWSSSNDLVATISNAAGTNGVATGAGLGQATITAAMGPISGTASINVSAATLVSISVTPPAPSIPNGTAQQFTATGTYTDLSTQDLTAQVTWAAIDTNIATISNAAGSQGLATAAHLGQTGITAKLGTIGGSANLTVTNAVLASIAVDPANKSIAKGTSQQYIATGTYTDGSTLDLTTQVTWASSAGTVAGISNANGTQGLAKSLTEGTTTISATQGTIVGSTTLTVSAAMLVSIAVTPTNPSIAKGTTVHFTATGTYTDNSTQDITAQVTWSPADGSIASVSNASGTNGLATGLVVGQTAIKADLSGQTGSTNLTVTAALLVSISVTPAANTMAKGTTAQYNATGTYTDNSTQDLTTQVSWSTGNGSIATVSNTSGSQGLVTAVAQGNTIVTGALGAISGSTTLTVSVATLVSISVTPANQSFPAGLNLQFSATGTYTDLTTQDLTTQVTWASSNTAAATISNAAGSHGLANTVAAGITSISATLGAISGSTTFTVNTATPVSIQVEPANVNVPAGTAQQYSALGFFSDGSTHPLTQFVTWGSTDPATAVVSNAPGSKGLATGLVVGVANIFATFESVTGTTPINVTSALLVSISVEPVNPTIPNGTTQQFHAIGTYTDNSTTDITTSVAWNSSSPSVASVGAATGLAQANTVGQTTIKASQLSISGTTLLNVSAAVLKAINVDPPLPTIPKGTTQHFTAIGVYTDNTTLDLTTSVTWSSSLETVATISNALGSEGLATAQNQGVTTITAALGSISGTATLTVSAASLVSIAVTPPTASIAKGTTVQFSATGTYTDNSTRDITKEVNWSPSSTTIATISNVDPNQGLATGQGVGQATITANVGSISGTATLNVTAATLVSIALTPPNPTRVSGTTVNFVATGTYTDSSTQDITQLVLWASTNSNVADISNEPGSEGLATALTPGSTTITATLGAVVGSTTLTVSAATLVSITVTPANPSVPATDTQQFTATGNYSDGSNQDLTTQVTWTSSNGVVAYISNHLGSQGRATALSSGSSVITAIKLGVSGFTTMTVP